MNHFKTIVPLLLVDKIVEIQKMEKEEQDQVQFPITSQFFMLNNSHWKWLISRGRPICVFQGRYRYRLLQIK